MFKKAQLKKNIKNCIDEITLLEAKRSRSQSSLVQAILEHKEADEEDVEYFNQYTTQINEVRNRMYEYQRELDSLG